jgi:ATP-dependent Clp protease adaptor protein ClpS
MPVATRRKGAAIPKPVDSGGDADEPWKTILFNCECHTFDQVERILIKATRCSLAQARAWSNEVHVKGSAVVYTGPREHCEAAADVIGSIGLKVLVTQ